MLHLAFLAALLLSPRPAGPSFGQPFSLNSQKSSSAEKALKLVSSDLADWFTARDEGDDLEESQESLLASISVYETEHGELLAQPDALRSVLQQARSFERKGPKPGKVDTFDFELGSLRGEDLEFAYRVPRAYDPEKQRYPLILAIPDFGEEPAEHLLQNWTGRDILEEAVLVVPEMPTGKEDWDQVAVKGRPGGLSHVLTVLRLATERFAIDADRIYVAGTGKGVAAALAAGNYGPQILAGVIGWSGPPADLEKLGPENYRNLPQVLFAGGTQADAWHTAAGKAGFDNCTLYAEGSQDDLWSWLKAHPRTSHPENVIVDVGKPYPTRVNWLRVAPTASDARVTARIESKDNRIVLEGAGVSFATLYLNDDLLDLDQPVEIVCNGSTFELQLKRSLWLTLELLRNGTSDASCVYVAEAVVDLREDAIHVVQEVGQGPERVEFERLLKEAGNKPSKLWDLYQASLEMPTAARPSQVLAKLLRLDPDHREARAAAGHLQAPEQYRNEGKGLLAGQWFTSADALARFMSTQEPEQAKAKGHVLHEGVWMHPDDRGFFGKGRVKDFETGQWLTAAQMRQLEEGWARQDLQWVDPERANAVDADLWWVDGEWLDPIEANRRRARMNNMWSIPSADVWIHGTANRDTCKKAAAEMARALPALNRVFGVQPVLPLEVCVLRDEEQYDSFAFGAPDGRRAPAHAGRLQGVHSALFAESWFRRVKRAKEFEGMGVCYWDPLIPYGDSYGLHSARLAVGLSYVEAIDPSPKAVRKRAKQSKGKSSSASAYYTSYQAEKKLPAWLRFGGAVYAERYFRDDRVGPDGDPWWARTWSLSNLAGRGGLRPLKEVMAFELNPDDSDDALKLYIEAGLLVSFMLDGDCAPLISAHQQLKTALLKGRLHASDLEALSEGLLAHEKELRSYIAANSKQ